MLIRIYYRKKSVENISSGEYWGVKNELGGENGQAKGALGIAKKSKEKRKKRYV